MKCIKISNTRAELLFCSLNLLFGDVLVAVARRSFLKLLGSFKNDDGDAEDNSY